MQRSTHGFNAIKNVFTKGNDGRYDLAETLVHIPLATIKTVKKLGAKIFGKDPDRVEQEHRVYYMDDEKFFKLCDYYIIVDENNKPIELDENGEPVKHWITE